MRQGVPVFRTRFLRVSLYIKERNTTTTTTNNNADDDDDDDHNNSSSSSNNNKKGCLLTWETRVSGQLSVIPSELQSENTSICMSIVFGITELGNSTSMLSCVAGLYCDQIAPSTVFWPEFPSCSTEPTTADQPLLSFCSGGLEQPTRFDADQFSEVDPCG